MRRTNKDVSINIGNNSELIILTLTMVLIFS